MNDVPYKLLWHPDKEREYQAFMAFDPNVRAWRNAFKQQYGEAPQTEGGNFDYRAAYLAGNAPQPVPGDSIPHWGSDGKTSNHPTMWKQVFMTQFGIDPDLAMQSGQMTPQMQQFLDEQIRRDMLAEMLMRMQR